MNLISQSQWAQQQGFSRQYVSRLVKQGIIPLVDGKIDPEQANQILAAIKDPSQPERRKQSKTQSAPDSKLSTIFLKTRIKNEMERGKILEADAKLKSGELVSAAEVQKAAFTQGRIVRDAMQNIPDRVSALLASLSDEKKIHEILSQEIWQALVALSSRDEDEKNQTESGERNEARINRTEYN